MLFFDLRELIYRFGQNVNINNFDFIKFVIFIIRIFVEKTIGAHEIFCLNLQKHI